jgi:molecular chaperone GrpE
MAEKSHNGKAAKEDNEKNTLGKSTPESQQAGEGNGSEIPEEINMNVPPSEDDEQVSCNTEELDKAEKKQDERISELTEDLRRLQAEFENFRKRTDKERCELIKSSSKDMLVKVIPIYDHLDLALKNTKNHEEFVKGIEMVRNQFLEMLTEAGVEPIKAKGEKFDPIFHEALLTEKSDTPDIILEELQKGYMFNGKVLKHSLVKVGK